MIVIYDAKFGDVVVDDEIKSYIEYHKDKDYVRINSEIMLTRMRDINKEKKIKIDHVIFKDHANNQDVMISINDHGRLDYWPNGFADYYEDSLYRLLYYNPP